MIVAWHTKYQHILPEKHKFPMVKYLKLMEILLSEKIFKKNDFFKPTEVELEAILRTHENDYWDKLKGLELTQKEERVMGFPQSDLLIERERLIMQGTLEGAINTYKR